MTSPETLGAERISGVRQTGLLIVNADDWGRDRETTDRTLECVAAGAVSSASGMVFMEDSERAASIALERSVDVGLHLNLTTPFSARNASASLRDHQQRIVRYLTGRRLAQVVFHPGLVRSFDYVVASQLEEFRRIYRAGAGRIDGHHHMHLCSNVVLKGLLPAGAIVRRNFSFERGEKGLANRLYRGFVDGLLARRHKMTDLFFSLPPLEPTDRLRRMFSMAWESTVEVETHPINPDEHEFLASGQIFRLAGEIAVAPSYAVLRQARK